MAQTIDVADYDAGRQEVIVARAGVVFGTNVAGADFAGVSGTKAAIAVPAGTVVVGGFYSQTSGTTANVDVEIGDGGDPDRYAAGIDGAAAGTTALVPTGYVYTSDDTIDFYVDTALPAAGGSGELVVMYMVKGRAAFVQK
jgi:hypothetical protein